MASLVGEEDDFTTCTVCWMEYDVDEHHPKVLSCFHSVCLQCAQSICGASGIPCPLCRKITPCPKGAVELPSNSHILCAMNSNSNKSDEAIDRQDLRQLHNHLSSKIAESLDLRKRMRAQLERTTRALRGMLADVENQLTENNLKMSELDSTLDDMNQGLNVALNDEMRQKVYRIERELAGLKLWEMRSRQESCTKIRIDLKDAYNQSIPTFPLFERGFLSVENESPHRKQYETERHLISHSVFSILRCQKIPLETGLGGLKSTFEHPSIENRQIAALRAELSELGEAQSTELAQLAVAVQSELSWDVESIF